MYIYMYILELLESEYKAEKIFNDYPNCETQLA